MTEREKFTGALVPRFWEDLRHLPMDVRALAAWLCTSRHNDAVPGLSLLAMPTIASDLGISEAELARLWAQLPPGFVEVDHERRLVRVPKQPKNGHSPNHKVIRAWWRNWQRLPDCPMRTAHVVSLEACLKDDCKAMTRTAWDETFGTIDTSTVDQSLANDTRSVSQASVVPVSDSESSSSQLKKTTQSSEGSSTRARRVGHQQQVLIAGEVSAAKAPSGWQRMLDEWHVRHEAWTGQKLVFGAITRHFTKAKAVMLELGADEVIRRIEIRFTAAPAWMDKDGVAPDFGQFFDRINDFAVPARPRASTRASPRATEDDLAAYAHELREQGR